MKIFREKYRDMLTDIQFRKIKSEYHGYIKLRIAVYAKVAALIALFVLPYFMYEDVFVNGMPRFFVLIRLVPFSLAVVLLAMLFTPLKKFIDVIRVLYFAFLLALMGMMVLLVIHAAHTDKYSLYVIGTVVVIFAIFGGAVYGLRLFIPLYLVPLAGLLIYLFAFTDIAPDRLSMLANPVTTAIVCIIFAEFQEQMRYREFISNKIVEIQNTQFGRELSLARTVQNSLIPLTAPMIGNIRFHSVYSPVIGIGGDYFDIIRINDRTAGIFISDVSGHGVSAALIASMVKTLINTAGELLKSPARLFTYINEKLIGQTSGHFVTAFYGIYDIDRKTFRYSRAGHTYPFLIKNGSIAEIRSRGFFLGLMKDLEFEEAEIPIADGDMVLLYTDGLIEACNRAGVMFETMFHAKIEEYSALGAAGLVNRIYSDLEHFTGSPSFKDDVCIICMEVPAEHPGAGSTL